MRLERWVATHGGVSRKQATALIKKGRVQVRGEWCRDPRHDVDETSEVRLEGVLLAPPPLAVVLHKPLGVVSTLQDPWGRRCLADVAADLVAQGLHPVGRLDAETDGLLPFSSDGALTQRLLHPRHGVEKVYRARVDGLPTEALITALAGGVETAEGIHVAEVRRLEGDVVELAVTEGKHRMVRRMLANAGFPVIELRRLSFGQLVLGALPAGEWRALDGHELDWLVKLRDGHDVQGCVGGT